MSSSSRFWPARKLGQLGLRIVLAALFLFFPAQVLAQNGAQVHLYQPETSHFPTITVNFETYDAAGSFITGLAPGDVSVLEDGTPHAASELNQIQPGLQITLALNTGPSLAYTYNNVSRFEQVRKVLVDWADSQPAPATTSASRLEGPDDFNLISTGSGLGTHLSDPKVLAQSLAGYKPDLMRNQPSLASLIQALDMATDPLHRPMMKRAILYVTPMLPDSALQALPNLADRANQLGIRVFVWLVLPNPVGDNAVTKALKDMAAHTGGQFFTYSGSEPFPDFNALLQPLRYYYQLTYASTIKQSGAHQISLSLDQAGQKLTSSDQVFTLNVQAPNPIFLDPPADIQRSWVTAQGTNAANSGSQRQGASLEPQNLQLQLLIEFPDGFQRTLKAVRFYVDNQLVSSLTSPPFDRLVWPLANYTSTANHTLRVEVEDQLGLVRSSIETPVEVTVAQPPGLAGLHLFGVDASQLLLPVGGGLAALAVVVGGAWLVRRRSQLKGKSNPTPQPSRPRRRLPMPVPLPVRRVPPQANAEARLMRISESGHVLPGSAIPLAYPEITIGRDPKKAAFVLESASVDALHARLVHSPEGEFRVYDAGSVAGTWVNYTLVTESGACLEHGDLLQIGREAFRFELNHPAPGRVAQVSPMEDNQV